MRPVPAKQMLLERVSKLVAELARVWNSPVLSKISRLRLRRIEALKRPPIITLSPLLFLCNLDRDVMIHYPSSSSSAVPGQPFRRISFLAVFLAFIGVVGCGSKHEKVVVQGKVTLDGIVVSGGDIRFYPASKTSGGVAGGFIAGGEYRVTNKGGVPVGEHRAVLRAFSLEGIGDATGITAAPVADDMLSAPAPAKTTRKRLDKPVYIIEGREQFFPPKFNADSELIVRITGDENPQVVDFELSSN